MDQNLSKPRGFESKNMPGGYAPASVPEFHQQTREGGYSNSAGPEGDGGGEEWPEADMAPKWAGQDTEHEDAGNNSDAEAKSGSDGSEESSSGDSGKGGVSTSSGGTRTKSGSTRSK